MKAKNNSLYLVNWLLIAFCGGVVLAEKNPSLLWLGQSFTAVSFIIVVYWLIKASNKARYGLIIFFVCIGFIRFMQASAVPVNDVSHWVNSNVTIIGKIIAEPQIMPSDDDKVMVKYIIAAQTVREKGDSKQVVGKVAVYLQQNKAASIAQYGDKLTAKGELKGIYGYRNPGQIDRSALAAREGLGAKLNAGKQGIVIESNSTWYWQKWVNKVRQQLLAAMQQVMPAADAAAIFAMLFGGYSGIRPELLESFTATGIVHILSVSGSHIALLAAVLQQFGKLCRIKPLLLAVLIVLTIIIYAGFAGFVVPVIRSAAMGILTFVALALEREKDARRLLSLTALVMLAIEPRWLFDISFQLSFGGTAGLLYWAESLSKKIPLPRLLAVSFAVTIAAQAAVLPLLAWYFNSLSLSSLLANFLIVPLIELLLIIGLVSSLIGFFVPLLQNILFVICSLLLGCIYTFASMLAALPFSTIYLPSGNFIFGCIYYFISYVLTGGYLPMGLNRWRIVAIISISCVLWLSVSNYLQSNILKVHFIDVGQGDAALIITPHNQAILVDTGGALRNNSSFDVGKRVVVPYLQHYGITKLDYLILTHAHDDHAGGAAAVCDKIPAKTIIIGRENRAMYEPILRVSDEKMAACIPAYQGQQWTVDGVNFAVMLAEEPSAKPSGNETSSVIKVSYGQHSFLFTGDLLANGETLLQEKYVSLKSTVLKVAHHGSKTSTTAEFLAAVQPEIAVISVGAANSFGHPAAAVVERLKSANAKILRTDQHGAIICRSDGKALTITTFGQD